MAKSLAESTALFKTAFLLILLSLVFHVAGFTTPNWSVVTVGGLLGYRTGLWKSCTDVLGVAHCADSQFEGQGWFVAVQTLESIGLVCLIILLLISLVLLVAVTNVRLSKVNVHVLGITVSFIGIGLIVYAVKMITDSSEFNLGYSFWLCACSTVTLFIAGILLELDRKNVSALQMNTRV